MKPADFEERRAEPGTNVNQNWNNVSGNLNQANAPGAQANQSIGAPQPADPRAELAKLVEALERLLETNRGQLGDAFEPAREQTAAAAEELSRERPRKTVLTSLLRGVAEQGQALASVVNAVHAVIEAVHRLL
jgi:hypothetical protein